MKIRNNYLEITQCINTIWAIKGMLINEGETLLYTLWILICNDNSLQLFDGYNARAPLVGTFCGTTPPGTFESTSNHVFLKFTSDETKTGRGFTVFYTINSRSSNSHFHTFIFFSVSAINTFYFIYQNK
jgi:hypothetical protein